MRYQGKIYRPPSEADAYILQATLGCSWNHCTYCDMYREKSFAVRELDETLDDLARFSAMTEAERVRKLFIADGDALVMPTDHWLPILDAATAGLRSLERVSCYATAGNVLEKTDEELKLLRARGLTRLYMGPESGDDEVLRRIAKGDDHDAHVEAARRAKAAGMELSAIFLLGAGGIERSAEHAKESARLLTEMDPDFAAALTLTVVPGTPQQKLVDTGRFELPTIEEMLGELRVIASEARPTDALFRTNHASNYLPLGGRLPADRARIVELIDGALSGAIQLRPEWSRGL
jgi:radical SAM superfamily enzyme YgiQ (UPF0313 family)